MEKHHGQIVEYIVRKNGYSITNLAAELKINRRSLYNWFRNKYLKRDVIQKIGLIIRHDFSNEFAELFLSDDFSAIYTHKSIPDEKTTPANDHWKDKYLHLLEKYTEALTTQVLNDKLDKA